MGSEALLFKPLDPEGSFQGLPKGSVALGLGFIRGLRVWGLGFIGFIWFGVWGLEGSGFRVYSVSCVWGLGARM